MYTILYNEFSKATLYNFTEYLLKAFDTEDTSSGMVGLRAATEDLRVWEQLNLYSYMTMDRLFTVILL